MRESEKYFFFEVEAKDSGRECAGGRRLLWTSTTRIRVKNLRKDEKSG